MSKSEIIKNDIISVIGITTISYDELIDTIVRIYGKEKEDSTVEMSGVKVTEMLNELLNSEIVKLANSVTNCPNTSKVLHCIYKTGEGMVYIMDR